MRNGRDPGRVRVYPCLAPSEEDGMNLKRSMLFPLVALAAPLVLLLGCNDSPMTGPVQDLRLAPEVSSDLLPSTCGTGSQVPLLAAKSIEVGSVSIGNDAEHLHITYQIHGGSGWGMAETHLDVGHAVEDIPTNGAGNPRLGAFPYGTAFDPPAHSWTKSIPLDDLDADPGDLLVIAAHAAMVHPELGNETAWADGEGTINPRERGGNWAAYTTYEVESCNAVEKVIGPEGDDISAGNATLIIGPGVLDEDVTVSVTPVPEEELPEGPLPGTAVELDAGNATFAADVTLQLTYNDEGMTEEEEGRLSIYLLDEARDVWMRVPSQLNAAENLLTADLPHLSIYAVVPDLFRLEIRNVKPQPVPENEGLDMQVWLWNISTGDLPTTPKPSITFTVVGSIEQWAYSSGECSLASSGTTHTFTCDNIANIPDPATAKVLSWKAYPAAGSAGTSIDASASALISTREVAVGTVSTAIDPPLTDADIEVSGEVSPESVSPGTQVQLTGHIVNLGPAHVDAVNYRIGVEGDVALPASVPFECTLSSEVPAGGGFYLDCVTGPLPDNFGSTPMLAVTPQSVGTVLFTLEVTGVTGATDPNPGNNHFAREIFVEFQP